MGDDQTERMGLPVTGVDEGEFTSALQRYSIRADVRRAAPELQVLNPHLQVQFSRPDYFPYHIYNAALVNLAYLLGALGVIVLVIAAWRRSKRKGSAQLLAG